MTTAAGSAPFEELAAKARRVHDAVSLVRGRAESGDGRVAAEVDAAGRITALTVTDDALAGGANALAATITDTHRRACDDADAAAQVLRDELAADPLVTRVVAAIDTKSAPAAHLPADAEQEDLHFANMSILRST